MTHLNDLLFPDTMPGRIAIAAATVPTGCDRPTGYPRSAGPLSDLAGAQKGGCRSLTISDNAGDDVGRVCRFTVYSLNEHPTATRLSTWGRLKRTYR